MRFLLAPIFPLLLLRLSSLPALVVVAGEEATTTHADSNNDESEEGAGSQPPSQPQVIVSIAVEMRPPDQRDECEGWAEQDECNTNPDFMLENCARSCGVTSKKVVSIFDSEDAAMGAFRFAEDSNLEANAESIALVLDTAKQLQSKLSENDAYTIPKDITHCGKRPCSAGKLWKRAEEMRKADMHDAAGADLIRALLKNGIEVDFRQKCEKQLAWALGSIGRQREREKREAIEEEKLEARRQAEREAMEEARKRKEEYEAAFVKFGKQIQESLAKGDDNSQHRTKTAAVGADGTVVEEDEGPSPETLQLIQQVQQLFVQNGPEGGNHADVIQLLKKISPSDKSTETLLIEARCHEILGNYKSALSAAGKLIQKAANHDPWINDSPRMMAATLGANAAMQMGLSDNALSFYQTVLKFDPDQARARKQYRGLKKVVKLMNKAEEQVRTTCTCSMDGLVVLLVSTAFSNPSFLSPCGTPNRSKKGTTELHQSTSMIVWRPCVG